ncbi:MAG: DegT/DnrJ/EryC1/StrS family aminotransferase [Anaerolineae bacterium]
MTQAENLEPLVIDGGRKTFHKDLTIPDPIPSQAFGRIEEILKSAKLFRYSGSTAEQSETAQLEKEFAAYLGVKYALGVTSCSSAIFIGLMAAGIKQGDKVLMPAFTFTAVPSSIVHAGAEPLLVETDDNYVINITDLKKKVAANPDAKFLLLSHMRGHVAEMDQVVEICEANDIVLMEDAAHALGNTYSGQQAGTFGTMAAFSFQSTKMINAGEGGMLTTNDPHIMAKAIILAGAYEKQWAKQYFDRPDLLEKYQGYYPAYNMRMSEVTAAIARPQIPNIDLKGKKFRENYFTIADILNKSEHIEVPDRVDNELPVPNSIQFNLRGLTGEKIRSFVETAAQEGIKIAVFGMAEDNARCFWNWRYLDTSEEELPITETMLKTACDLRLPVFLDNEDVTIMGSLILRAIERVKDLQENRAVLTPAD